VTVTPDTIFANSYQPYPIGVSRSGPSNEIMMQAYQQKDYTAVLSQYSAMASPDQSALFFAGQSFFATKDYSKAAACFNKLLVLNSTTQTRDFNDDAEYYLALSYLKTNAFNSAFPLLQKIHNNANHLYSDKVSSGVMRKLYFLRLKK
jgi:tetratricopeptide (TPR) repeat protein